MRIIKRTPKLSHRVIGISILIALATVFATASTWSSGLEWLGVTNSQTQVFPIAQPTPPVTVVEYNPANSDSKKIESVKIDTDSMPSSELINATTYPFTSGTGTLEDMSTGTTLLVAAGLDDTASSVFGTGFDFWFDGIRYNAFSANANGLMRLGTTAVGTTFSNDLASTTNVPQIAPYWDDLWIGTNGKVHAKVVGTAPNRKLVVEWQNMTIPRQTAATTGAATFQAWIYESTGVIEFVYGSGMVVNSTNSGYSVGFGSSATAFASITTTTPSVAYGTANNTQTNTITAGTKYTFTPLVPADPTGLNFTGVGLSSMTLNWTDNSSNELGFPVYISTDNINFSYIGQAAANATSVNVTGLSPATTYYFRVFAVTEGALSANSASGSQATNAGTISGNKNIPGDYATLTAAFADINTNGLAGAVNLVLQSGYNPALETYPLVPPASPITSGTNTITVYPAVSGF